MLKTLYAVIMAAGSGSRMGADQPKQFIRLEDKPILRMTIEKFVSAVPDVRIITVLPQDYIPYWREYCAVSNFSCRQTLVAGGITRFHSVRNALERVPEGVTVAIHDGVRPFVPEDLIREMRNHMETCPALIPVMPCVDTMVRLEGGLDSTGTPLDRTGVYAVQTPQMFRSEELKQAYSGAYDTSFTDDSAVARRFGIPLSYIEGDRSNIKLTTPHDLALARALISISGR